MNFTLLITGNPVSGNAARSALAFARAAIEAGHRIDRVFLHGEGVYLANQLATPPQDETNLARQWLKFITDNSVECTTCIASGLRRGVVDQDEADRYKLGSSNLFKEMPLGGLGQLMGSISSSDRLIQFR
jgi:tRNA 2-thiouridine synthesizing protein D